MFNENALHKGNCPAAMATPSDSSECYEQLLKAFSSGVARGVATDAPAPLLLKEVYKVCAKLLYINVPLENCRYQLRVNNKHAQLLLYCNHIEVTVQ